MDTLYFSMSNSLAEILRMPMRGRINGYSDGQVQQSRKKFSTLLTMTEKCGVVRKTIKKKDPEQSEKRRSIAQLS